MLSTAEFLAQLAENGVGATIFGVGLTRRIRTCGRRSRGRLALEVTQMTVEPDDARGVGARRDVIRRAPCSNSRSEASGGLCTCCITA